MVRPSNLSSRENMAIKIGVPMLIALIVAIIGTALGMPFWIILPAWVGVDAVRLYKARNRTALPPAGDPDSPWAAR